MPKGCATQPRIYMDFSADSKVSLSGAGEDITHFPSRRSLYVLLNSELQPRLTSIYIQRSISFKYNAKR